MITQFILKASNAFAHVLLPVLAPCRFLPLFATLHSGLATMSWALDAADIHLTIIVLKTRLSV